MTFKTDDVVIDNTSDTSDNDVDAEEELESVCLLFSDHELKFMFAICHRPSVCLSSVCNVAACLLRRLKFSAMAILDLCIKILRRSSQGNPFVGG